MADGAIFGYIAFSSPNEEMLSVLSSDEGSMLQGKNVCVIYR